jgi:hypothetical protein
MIRSLAALAFVTVAASAAAATGVRWTPLAQGTTEPSGAQAPVGYLAVTRAQERLWSGRLTSSDRAALQRLNLTTSAAVAVFLDGMPCASKVAVSGVTRASSTLTVHIVYTPLPIGVGMCVRTSTAYFVLAAARGSLGRPVPARVAVVARARA